MGATTVGRVSQCPPRFCAPCERPSVVSEDVAASGVREPLRTKGLRVLKMIPWRLVGVFVRRLMSSLCHRYVFANNPLLSDPHNRSPK